MNKELQVSWRTQLTARVEMYKKLLPPSMSVEKFTESAIISIIGIPELQKCTEISLFAAVYKAAQVGMIPDGRRAAIVPFGKTATFMPMVYGIVERVFKTNRVLFWETEIVYKAKSCEDIFDETFDSVHGKKIVYKSIVPPESRVLENAVGAFTVLKTDMGTFSAVLTKQQVLKIGDSSRNKHLWKNHWQEMWKKTVIKNLAKRCPMFEEDTLNFVRTVDDEAKAISGESEGKNDRGVVEGKATAIDGDANRGRQDDHLLRDNTGDAGQG